MFDVVGLHCEYGETTGIPIVLMLKLYTDLNHDVFDILQHLGHAISETVPCLLPFLKLLSRCFAYLSLSLRLIAMIS